MINLKNDDLNYSLIPEWGMESMKMYVEHGCPLGDFLEAVFSNNLFEAVSRADGSTRILIPLYVRWIYNHAPMACHGSYHGVQKWIKDKREKKERIEK